MRLPVFLAARGVSAKRLQSLVLFITTVVVVVVDSLQVQRVALADLQQAAQAEAQEPQGLLIAAAAAAAARRLAERVELEEVASSSFDGTPRRLLQRSLLA